ncbi:glycosyltransferase family 4 protein [Acaryochloris marina]|uniref:glycosyltransferase family 4 protein n=1 Tax=Acaryochloris marina TaxID=155978 RepID=UPI001BAF4D64|nr:glycosyltransferase family 4 protein [Acaryochloris marina]QUY41685.1 glycosyltransferase family 4 protein [Acaryochloris marina S15]
MKQHRILFVNHVGALAGAEYCCLSIAAAYRATSQMLLFEDGPFRQVLEKAGVPVTVVNAPDSLLSIRTSSGLASLKAIPALWQMAQQIAKASQGFDFICANSQKAFIASSLATLIGTPPLVWHLRDILTAKHFSGVNRRVAITLANSRAAQVWVASQATADAFIAVGGRPDLVKVMYDGIESDRFDQVTPDAANAVRQELGLGDVPLVGLFSRLSPWKGQHVLIEALRSLPDVHGLLVGDALFGEQDYVSMIKEMAATDDLADRIHWLGFRQDVPALMKACDIVIHASTEPEPCARIAIEGQLAQKPVIATAAGGMLEVIADRQSGRLVPPGNADVLAAAIRELLNDQQLASTLAKQGMQSAATKFAPEVCLGAVDQALTTLV